MREIKKMDASTVQPKQELKAGKAEIAQEVAFSGAVEEKVIQDFSNPKAETLGRSQVSKTDNLQADVAFGMTHPEAIAKADNFFDQAYAQLQAKKDPNAYENACKITSAYVSEFHA